MVSRLILVSLLLLAVAWAVTGEDPDLILDSSYHRIIVVEELVSLSPVVVLPFGWSVAMGDEAGYDPVRRFGHNDDVDATFEVISHVGGTQFYLGAAEKLQVVSSDADDDGDPAGDGARTVFLKGLDADYEVQAETLTMNGQDNVESALTYLRVFSCYAITAGATGINEGTISVKDNGAANTIVQIAPLEGNAHAAIFTVPAGQTLYITQVEYSESSNKGTEVHLFVCPFGGAWRSAWVSTAIDVYVPFKPSLPLKFQQKTDIELRSLSAALNASVTGGIVGYRVDN